MDEIGSEKIRQKIKAVEDEIATLTAQHDQVEARSVQASVDDKAYASAMSDAERLREQIGALHERRERLCEALVEAEGRELDAEIDRLTSEEKTAAVEFKYLSQACEREHKAEVERNKTALEKIAARRRGGLDALKDLRVRLQAARDRRKARNESKIGDLRDRRRKLTADIQRLEHTLQGMENHTASEREPFKRQLQTAQASLDRLQRQHDAIVTQRENIESDIAVLSGSARR